MSTRKRNMERRRRRILHEARLVIAEHGFDALTTRGLAKAAGLSQPTLYNLIGSKEDIILALVQETLERIWSRLDQRADAEPLEAIEAVVDASTGLFGEDEAYYQAAVIAMDRTFGPMTPRAACATRTLFSAEEAVRMAASAVQRAINAGLLRGRISAEVLGEQMFICFRGPLRDWAYGLIALAEFRARAMRGFYMALAIDAEPAFRTVVEDKLLALTAPVETSRNRRA